MIAEKGLRVDDKLIEEVDKKVSIPETGLLLQRGKKQFAKVVK